MCFYLIASFRVQFSILTQLNFFTLVLYGVYEFIAVYEHHKCSIRKIFCKRMKNKMFFTKPLWSNFPVVICLMTKKDVYLSKCKSI